MSHTLHRLGNSQNLTNDWIVFAMSAKGVNELGSAERLRQFMKIALKHKPLNYGDMKTGNSFTVGIDDLLSRIEDVSIVHAVFASAEVVATLLRELRVADLGISVVVSGLVDAAARCAESANLRSHTIEYSLGIWGRTDLLPGQHLVELTTMCGHGMIAAGLIEALVGPVRRGKLTIQDAALKLAKPCVCGVFNHERAAMLLTALVAQEKSDEIVSAGMTTTKPII